MPNGGTWVLQNLKGQVVRSWETNKEPAGPIPARKEVCFSLLSGEDFSECHCSQDAGVWTQLHRATGFQGSGRSNTMEGLEHHMKLRVWKRYCLSPRLQLRVCIYLWKAAASWPNFRYFSQHWSPFTQSFISSWKNNANTRTSSAIFLQHGTLIMLARLVFQIHKQISSKALTTSLILLWHGLNTL